MQECIDIIYNKSSSLTEKQKAIKQLDAFKKYLTEFCDDENCENDCDDEEITEDDVDDVIDELSNDLQELTMDSIDDIKTLFNIRGKINRCNDILHNMTPQIILCEEEDTIITNKIKSKFTIASTTSTAKSTNIKAINWQNIDKCYQLDKLSNVINSKYKQVNAGKIIYPKVCFDNTYNTTSVTDHCTTIVNVNGNNRFELKTDENDYVLYFFMQYDSHIFCAYYTNEEILHIVCNNGTTTISNPDGISIESTDEIPKSIYKAILEL